MKVKIDKEIFDFESIKDLRRFVTEVFKNGFGKQLSKEVGKAAYKEYIKDDAKKVIDYLNKKTGSKFRTVLPDLTARLREGYSINNLKDVIDYLVSKWSKDEKMRPYLRPSTIFRVSKFEGYFSQAVPWKREQDRIKKIKREEEAAKKKRLKEIDKRKAERERGVSKKRPLPPEIEDLNKRLGITKEKVYSGDD